MEWQVENVFATWIVTIPRSNCWPFLFPPFRELFINNTSEYSVHWDLWQSYLVYSVLFTIMRFFTVLLVASTIRDTSQKPLKFIYKVASANWNVELTRFFKHIRTGRLALSGRGLFYFTRQLILTVINIFRTTGICVAGKSALIH